jgi:hypothetical protein
MKPPLDSVARELATLVTGQRDYRPLGLLLRAVAALLKPRALVVASSLAHSPTEAFLRDHCPQRLQRFLPLLDPRVNGFGRFERRADVTMVGSVLLSDRDVDAPHTHAGSAQTLLGLRPRASHKKRRLDTMFGAHISASQQVAAILVAESPQRTFEVLSGSTAVLANDQPLLLLALDGQPGTAECLQLLQRHHYTVFDPCLWAHEPTDLQASHWAARGEWLMAMPREHDLPSLARLLFGGNVPSWQGFDGWNRWLAQELWREARQTGIAFQPYRSSGSLTMSLDNELPAWGLHPHEGEPGGGWAWIGPRRSAGFVLPTADQPLHRVSIYAAAAATERNRNEVAALLDGEAAHVRCDWSQGFGVIDITPRRPGRLWRPMHCLELSVPDVRRASDDDARLLSLSLSSVVVRGARG